MWQLKEKVVMVVGGNSGIGAASVNFLLSLGTRVGVVDLNIDMPISNERQLHLSCDVRREDEVNAAIAAVSSHFGGLDGVVYSAGVQRYGTVIDTPSAVWDECLQVNLTGAYLVGKYAVPLLIARGGGSIVHVSSVQALANQQNVAVYVASKGGLNALTRAMAIDHARDHIRVNVVCPGSVDTPMLRASAAKVDSQDVEETLKQWGALHPLGRIATPVEVAQVIAFLLSPLSSFVSGAEYKVDGGLTAALAVRLRENP